MIRHGEHVFVDTGAWIAMALTRDPLHERAREAWKDLGAAGARLHTTVPVVLETFTFLDRNAARHVAVTWKDSLAEVARLRVHACTADDLAAAWSYFERADLHKLSAVDATSFALMRRERLHRAFAFDHHFAVVGFALVG